jgi:hypothetical protein
MAERPAVAVLSPQVHRDSTSAVTEVNFTQVTEALDELSGLLASVQPQSKA